MICPHCGSETRSSGAFCTRCGRTLEVPRDTTDPTRTGGQAPPPSPTSGPAPPPPPSDPGPAPPSGPAPPTRTGSIPPGRSPALVGALIVAVLVALGAVGWALTRGGDEPEPTPLPATPEPTPELHTAEPTQAPTPTTRQPDCSAATRPGQGSEQRRLVLDGLRRQSGYDGRYQVQVMTILGEWAYVEAAPFDEQAAAVSGPFRGYLVRFDGQLWNHRWEGAPRPNPDGPGNPPFPQDFTEPARDVLRC